MTKAAIDAENVRLQDASCRPDERCRIFDNELLVINDTRRLLLPYIPEGGCAEAKA